MFYTVFFHRKYGTAQTAFSDKEFVLPSILHAAYIFSSYLIPDHSFFLHKSAVTSVFTYYPLKRITMILLSKELRRLSKLYIKAISKELPAPHTEYMAELMLILSTRKAPITQKELTKHMQVDKSRMVIMIEELNKLEYIFIERNPADRREHFVFLTEGGRKLVPGIKQAIEKVNLQIRRQLDQAGIDHFYATIQQMGQNLLLKP